MTQGTLETELTVFVPPDEPAGVYLLTVRNQCGRARRLRLAPYFQMVLAGQPEYSGPLRDPSRRRRSTPSSSRTRATRSAPGRPSSPCRARPSASRRGGAGSSATAGASPVPTWWSAASRTPAPTGDDRPIAAFLTTLEVPARGETHRRRGPGPGRRPGAGRGGHPQVSGPRRRPGRPRRDPAVVAEPDGHGLRSRRAARSSTATSTG